MADETQNQNQQTNNDGTQTPGTGAERANGTTDTGAADGAAAAGTEKASGLADGAKADASKDVKGPANFPDNWREQMAPKGADGKPDAKALALLQRYADPTMATKGLIDLQNKISNGEFKRGLEKDATPEQIKQFREENAIPEKVEDYAKLATPEGIVIGDADKPLVGSFMEKMLAENVPPAIAQKAVAAYYANVDHVMAQQDEADSQYVTTQEDALRQEWGADYRPNMNAISNLLSTMPESVAKAIIHARGPDGRLLGDNKEFRQALAQLALERNPAATVLPAGTGDPAKGLDDKIKEYEKMMNTDIKAWHKNADAQKEYANLLQIKSKMPAQGQGL